MLKVNPDNRKPRRLCKICKLRKTTGGSKHGYQPTWFVCADCYKQLDRPTNALLRVMK